MVSVQWYARELLLIKKTKPSNVNWKKPTDPEKAVGIPP